MYYFAAIFVAMAVEGGMGIGHNHAAWVNELVVMVIEKIEAGYFTRVDTSTVCI